MFDIGFFELLVIGVVALLVIGPEQLPGTLRTMALWWGRMKRGLQATRTELEQQLGADDIRRQLHNEEVMKRLEATKQDIERTLREDVADIEQQLKAAAPAAENTPDTPDNPLPASKQSSAND
ncbi:Sec-independent protein translocase protein TatB [Pseudomaricurvus sp. HS19]|uniref:Sec-independent protein translocase protein TatB n=1 Tax=Pseudomaricurvus sp. HS19 TaxID=2692626 RepID=UPI00136BD555|nr:twin-arginine translocase subunit TatB [Pseudomaricurvus sp. HS19]